MNAAPFPLERWAARAPATRWPLVLLLIVALIGMAGGATTPPDCNVTTPEVCP